MKFEDFRMVFIEFIKEIHEIPYHFCLHFWAKTEEKLEMAIQKYSKLQTNRSPSSGGVQRRDFTGLLDFFKI